MPQEQLPGAPVDDAEAAAPSLPLAAFWRAHITNHNDPAISDPDPAPSLPASSSGGVQSEEIYGLLLSMVRSGDLQAFPSRASVGAAVPSTGSESQPMSSNFAGSESQEVAAPAAALRLRTVEDAPQPLPATQRDQSGLSDSSEASKDPELESLDEELGPAPIERFLSQESDGSQRQDGPSMRVRCSASLGRNEIGGSGPGRSASFRKPANNLDPLAEMEKVLKDLNNQIETSDEDQQELQSPRHLLSSRTISLSARKEVMILRQWMIQLVSSRVFVVSGVLAILANAVFIGIELDLKTDDNEAIWNAFEAAFTGFFTIELLCRFAASQSIRRCFFDAWNVFDAVVVSASLADVFITAMAGSSGMTNFASLRVVRLARVARVVRLLRFLDGLRRLLVGILNAFSTLVWTWILLALVVYIFSIIATRLIGQSNSENAALDDYFGTVVKSMFTLFQVTTASGWSDIAALAVKVEPWTAFFFMIYLHVTTFAILNVMMAVIVENTLDQAGNTRSKFERKKLLSHRQAFQEIFKVFKDADSNADGLLNKDEYAALIKRADMSKHFESLGLKTGEVENLFGILDYDGSGCLDATEFVHGLLKAVGKAKARDIMAAHCSLKKMEKEAKRQIAALAESTNSQISGIEKGVADLRSTVKALAKAYNVTLPSDGSSSPKGSDSRSVSEMNPQSQSISPSWKVADMSQLSDPKVQLRMPSSSHIAEDGRGSVSDEVTVSLRLRRPSFVEMKTGLNAELAESASIGSAHAGSEHSGPPPDAPPNPGSSLSIN